MLFWGDGHGFFHVRAAFGQASLTVPFSDRRLLLGTWQQIVLVDFDNRTRNRRLILQFLEEWHLRIENKQDRSPPPDALPGQKFNLSGCLDKYRPWDHINMQN